MSKRLQGHHPIIQRLILCRTSIAIAPVVQVVLLLLPVNQLLNKCAIVALGRETTLMYRLALHGVGRSGCP